MYSINRVINVKFSNDYMKGAKSGSEVWRMKRYTAKHWFDLASKNEISGFVTQLHHFHCTCVL